ncbi:MAG TPA: transcriptional regulator [Cyanobacteria bacterium UBA11049]|nr:transcriptional regulator [Cyanobacteria bacterium UBA11049]
MAKSLQYLFGAIASAQNERQLRLAVMDNVGEYVGVQRWGIHILDEYFRIAESDIYGLPNAFIERYIKVGRAVDPVLRYVVERHAPAHEELVLPPGGWKKSQLYQNCCAYYDHEHIMTGPIVGGGRLIGTVHFARVGGTSAFDANDLADVGAVCNHLSAKLAMLRMTPNRFESSLASRLTPRELQIAELVAQGLTNAEIGVQLWITENSVKQALKRIFRKLDVSARAQMVARLQNMLR